MAQGAFSRRRPRESDGTSPSELAVFEATERLLSETSLQSLTVAQIIERAKLSRANFYHYFANKYSVLVAMLGRLFEESYSDDAPWNAADPTGARAIGDRLDHTLGMWSKHGAVICAVVEHMHSRPVVAEAWQFTSARFVAAIREQIVYERESGGAPDGPAPALLAAMLVSGAERAFYVSARGLDPLLKSPTDVVEPLVALAEAAVLGSRGRRAPNGLVSGAVGGSLARVPASGTAPAAARLGPQADGVDSDTSRGILGAMAALLEASPLAEISVARILDRAGTSRASFYFYFRSKEDAFVALFRSVADVLVDAVASLACIDVTDEAAFIAAVRGRRIADVLSGAVIRNAVHVWPRLPELRTAYLQALSRMADVFTTLVEAARAERQATVAPGSVSAALQVTPIVDEPPAAPYAATLVWTIERTVAGAFAGEAYLSDLDAVVDVAPRVLYAALFATR
ncbi:TetR/AcrR family transcriptional regulator [Tsukamurella soli]|uniref:HTH tetR-type domain-containing protein n=1 Tax=Tsukamurella soli TaxID=644556 RepID=A0ABP8JZS5_9ACTN